MRADPLRDLSGRRGRGHPKNFEMSCPIRFGPFEAQVETSNQGDHTMHSATIDQRCSPAARVTRSLLGYGVIAGPFYVVVSLAQALTRDGFRLDQHAWSLLENGGLGWIQITNFILTGLMTVAGAAGLRRAL